MKPCFKALHDPLLLKASAELTPLAIERVGAKSEYTFSLIDRDKLVEASPSLKLYMEKIGLLDKMEFAAIPMCPAYSSGVIHTDIVYPEALNIPIYNCANSFFAWYDAELEDREVRNTVVDGEPPKDIVAKHMFYRFETAKEIARVSCSQPVWFNTKIPHRGFNIGNGSRAVATIRFSCKEILEYFE